MDGEDKSSKNQSSSNANEAPKSAEEETLKRELEKELESNSGSSGFSVPEKKFQPQRPWGSFPFKPSSRPSFRGPSGPSKPISPLNPPRPSGPSSPPRPSIPSGPLSPPKSFPSKPSPISGPQPKEPDESKPSIVPPGPSAEEKRPFLDYMSKEGPSAGESLKEELSKPEDLSRGGFSEPELLTQKTEKPKITPETSREKLEEKLKEEKPEEKKPEIGKEEFISKTEPPAPPKMEVVSPPGPIKKETSDLPAPPKPIGREEFKAEKKTFISPSPPRFSVPESPGEKEFSREREFPRERKFIPSKKEGKEYVSREEDLGGPKEIIRTFQKDLFRRQAEVEREEKIPGKGIPGFTPPKPPEEPEYSRASGIRIPRIPIPKISLKFAIIIVAVVLVLSGFYLIFQLKPCLPPFCKGDGKILSPLPLCDKEAIKNICPNQNEPLPDCDTQKLCQELNIVSCVREEICKSLVPASTCEPVELITPISLLPFISEERIIILQKSKSEILSGLNSINNAYPKPSLIRILIEYSPDECHRSWLSIKEFFEAFGISAPENLTSNLKENYTSVYYLPDDEEKNACLASQIESPLCYSPRLAIVFSVVDSTIVKSMMGVAGWEATFFANFKPFILGEPKEETLEFKDYLYKDKVPLRYKNLPISTTALNYGIYKNLLIIGTSKNSLTKTIDLILNKEAQDEAERRMLEGENP